MMDQSPESFHSSNVLITGGLGFIGTNLARKLVDYDANIALIDGLVPDNGGHLHNISDLENRVRINISDVRDEHSLNYLVQAQGFLFNPALQISHRDSSTNYQKSPATYLPYIILEDQQSVQATS